MKTGKILVGLLVALGIVAFLSVIIVKEVNQAIILQFGDPKRIIMKPGLNFKIPFIQNVVYLDKRILNLDTPPEEVIASDQKRLIVDAFRDVQAARADRERSKNEAEAYANDVIPRARGEAEQILQLAEAYKKEVVAKAEGEASRFLAIYNEYKNAKVVTQERMYLETMERVLADIDKVIIEKNAGSGVVPYLPLPELKKKATN